MLSKNICPFGKSLQKYWDRRYGLFSRFDEGIQTDEVGLYSATPESIALEQARRMGCKTVIDGFAGIGGNTVAFARLCEKVYAIEKDKDRIRMAENNAKIYGVEKKIVFIHGDFFQEIPKLRADGIFIDPLWKLGPKYTDLKKFSLSDFEPDGNKIIEAVFARFEKIALKVPEQFDFSCLAPFNMKYETEDNKMKNRILMRTVYFLNNKIKHVDSVT